ncbi:hypothetical protein A2331_04265 [Candidatus Falkowbacteria bacterium RIFOXYB2_FULL_34_18]|uniref:Uncharacterized protein n=1 Tax=Candidatus Falkowbacteria bacterium RIFOXYD2_FULL_34_120 TaxID=1798007 RepID=A0A1F5TN84_9BACT|nr:MAG: hypothetical protein A2500_04605 [Candidatus Falkowbacteria bacterium RIFOXYC12_FULL_34_55]OGF28882.1 MAG: hypothetical protein A2331_04265 [Candidatus Falkowbacteria bacterium RIFOXYB2_FULL_34_18]OGF35648.1 MAG: hypothetical protein A2466_04620 [Candidatus Falkowbacteria bacterium RIFOXYC2_FULL_34_220]OGF38394.1 MAG: hypothetical protein A2515_02925 [Candidatus Falkowbacteria bacterium RIFOXYD12_FULL_34_57]OGF40442.1 MAG: hypothetical protein A2531_02810 [Candidatus Falkowbacteria bact
MTIIHILIFMVIGGTLVWLVGNTINALIRPETFIIRTPKKWKGVIPYMSTLRDENGKIIELTREDLNDEDKIKTIFKK